MDDRMTLGLNVYFVSAFALQATCVLVDAMAPLLQDSILLWKRLCEQMQNM